MPTDAETEAMRRALALARRGDSHPNPCVGAVILSGTGERLAEGVTERWPGLAHAERVAISRLPPGAPAATLVVTLEPCGHTGRSTPCSDAILDAGIRRVVVGALDPDHRVQGTGLARLEEGGVEVESGVLAEEVEEADPAYFHHRRTGRPRFVVKSAVTVDGQTAALDGTSRWITSKEAREDGHRLRSASDAVMVGAGTLIADDPLLTVRTDDHAGPQPLAVVVAGRRGLPSRARLWTRSDVVVYASDNLDVPAEVVVVDGDDGLPRLSAVADDLSERGALGVLVEGGATLVHGLWRSGLVDAGVSYLGAVAAGGSGVPAVGGRWETMEDSRRLVITDVTRVGPDVKVEWRVRESRLDR